MQIVASSLWWPYKAQKKGGWKLAYMNRCDAIAVLRDETNNRAPFAIQNVVDK